MIPSIPETQDCNRQTKFDRLAEEDVVVVVDVRAGRRRCWDAANYSQIFIFKILFINFFTQKLE